MKQFIVLIIAGAVLTSSGAMGYSNYGYPYYDSQCRARSEKNPCPADDYGFCRSNCTSFVAYVLNAVYGIPFKNDYRDTLWSNGGNWDNAAGKISGDDIVVDQHAIPGDVAYWNSGTYGHVAFVEKVHYDSSGNVTGIDVTEYNYTNACMFDSRSGNNRLNLGDSDYPDGFIHILAYNEGVTSLHYLDCYEMYTLCDFQTLQEWGWILSRVEGYRCRNCSGQYMTQANDFYDAFAMGGSTGEGTSSGPLPNLLVKKIEVHDDVTDSLLTEQTSYMNISQTYEVRVWPKAEEANCVNGMEPGKNTVETDTFWKIALKESDGDWKFLGRNYTKAMTLTKDNSNKELLHFIVPSEAAGQRIYFRSKVDSTGEVIETNEHDNWSDVEWYPVSGNCDLTISYARLTGNRTSLNETERYGFEMSVKNLGPDPCPMDIRTAYYHKKPGSSVWEYVADDGTPASKLIPNQENPELTLDEPFVADAPGTHGIMACADYLNANQETNKSNNCATSSFEVKAYRPDLVITQVGLTGGRTSLVQGDHFGLSIVIQNQGNAPATVDTRSAYYLMPPGSSTWQYQTDDLTTAVQMCVGCSKTEWNTTDPFVANVTGTWQGMTCADNWNWQSELDETNNCKSFSFYVSPAGPDLIVSSLGIKEGTVIAKGTYIHPWCTVKNIGNRTPSADSRLAYYIDGVYRTDDFVGASQVNPGQEKYEEVQSNIIKLGNTGTRTYTCCADHQGKVIELNESNNCASISLVVR